MSTDNFHLIIGNKNLSSWSLRPWLVLTHFGIPFHETLIRLDRPETRAKIREHSPSGLVPCLFHGEFAVWDSLAICEYLNELFPDRAMWPEERHSMARARSISLEMHSGFSALRTVWPMEFCRERADLWGGPAVRRDVARILQIFDETLEQFGNEDGPFLFGRFSIADAMFAPVISRFRTYGPVHVPARVIDYMDAVWTLPAMRSWGDGAREEVDAGWYE